MLWLLTARDSTLGSRPGHAGRQRAVQILPPVSAAEPTPYEAEGTEAMPEAAQSELTLPQAGIRPQVAGWCPPLRLGCGRQRPLPGRCPPYGRWRSSSESTALAHRPLMSRPPWRPPPTRAAWSL